MQQFIPFEDDWDALEQLRPEALIPYRAGLVPVHPAAMDLREQPQGEASTPAIK
jgi:hypothetical protein